MLQDILSRCLPARSWILGNPYQHYVVADILSVTIYDVSAEESYTFFIALAVLFLIDSLLYMAAWYLESDRSLDFWAYGPLLYLNPTLTQMIFVRAIAGLANVLGMGTFSFDSLFYMTSWFHGTDKSESVFTKLQTADLWGETLNVTPSFLYLFATIAFLLDILHSMHDEQHHDEQHLDTMILDIRARTESLFIVYSVADILYTIDACCYAHVYFRDKEVELRALQAAIVKDETGCIDTEGKDKGSPVSNETPRGEEEEYLRVESGPLDLRGLPGGGLVLSLSAVPDGGCQESARRLSKSADNIVNDVQVARGKIKAGTRRLLDQVLF
eukprot:g45129.t1